MFWYEKTIGRNGLYCISFPGALLTSPMGVHCGFNRRLICVVEFDSECPSLLLEDHVQVLLFQAAKGPGCTRAPPEGFG